MNIVILSASTGGGHLSAANAIKQYFISKGIETEVVDAIEYISPILNKTVTEVYEYIALKQPKIWKMVYDSANKKTGNKLVAGINSIISKKLLPLIEKSKPDAIISTHPFTTEMVSNLKSNNLVKIPLVCVMTDYAPHRTWTSPNVDAYIVANSNMVEGMKDMGVDPKIIYPYGIPVDDSFYFKYDKKKVLEELSLDASKPTILLMAGKGGLANIDKVYYQLQTINIDFQIIVITGKNPKLYNKIKSLSENRKKFKDKIKMIPSKISKHIPGLKHIKFRIKFKKFNKNKYFKTKKTKVIYFTKEVEKYMSVSDLIITKPGGLTVSEALACGLPMALFNAIPGQEEENANFLVSNNMAVRLEKNAAETIKALLTYPSRLQSMKFSCENFDKSGSLENILVLTRKLTSKEKHCDKLVRDKIPQIIKLKGNIPETEILDQNTFIEELKIKLVEESNEVKNASARNDEVEEMADVLEVFYELAESLGISFEEIEKARKNKLEERGGFKSKIFLKSIVFSSENHEPEV